MKTVLAASVLLSVGFVLEVLWKELTAYAAGGGGTPVGNGDVNGDGKLDIADAIYIINHQFRAGPEPVAIDCPPTSGKGLPATGQTKCYNALGDEIACDNASYPGQDAFYQAGCLSEGRFVDHGDGTVTDTCTGLMWQKETAAGPVNWKQALQYCTDLRLAGHLDWRLPNVRELQSIVDYGRRSPAIDPVFGALSAEYWSSSSGVDKPSIAWLVDFHDGYVVYGYVFGYGDGPFYVRAVRG